MADLSALYGALAPNASSAPPSSSPLPQVQPPQFGALSPQPYGVQAAGLLADPGASPEIDIQGHKYEMIPPDQFNHNMYDLMERYFGKYPKTNPPAYLLGNDPTTGDKSEEGIKYWRRKSAPFAGS